MPPDDERLTRRLRQIENQVRDWEAKLPSIQRELAELHQLLEPAPSDSDRHDPA